MGNGRRGDEEVVGTDRLASFSEIGPSAGMFAGYGKINGEDFKVSEQRPDEPLPGEFTGPRTGAKVTVQ